MEGQGGKEIQALPLTNVINHAQLLGKTLYAQGDLSYLEAVNKETLRNSYNQFSSYANALISILPATKDGKVPARVRLNQAWMPTTRWEANNGSGSGSEGSASTAGAEGLLWEFCEKISRGRREGKNRRDGGTVVRRVLGHVELVGKKLWESSSLDGSSGGRGTKGTKKSTAGSGRVKTGQDIQAQARSRQGVLAKL